MDYLTLGLGSLTSIVTEVDVSAWGHRVTLSCQYNPGSEDRLYTITFHAALARETPNPLLMCLFDGCTSSVLLAKEKAASSRNSAQHGRFSHLWDTA